MNVLRDLIFQDIDGERDRQEQLKAAGRFDFTCADVGMSDLLASAVVSEEVGESAEEFGLMMLMARLARHNGELARAVMQERDSARVKLRKELIQTAAVCVAWIEKLDGGVELFRERESS